MSNWFDVNKKGLAKLMEGRDKAFVLYELLQNAWDEATKVVTVSILPIEGTREVNIRVEDDSPEGFRDLAHAYTLFAESDKKADPTKRGRFNMGEKLVLALATKATIETTKGTVTFSADGRETSRKRRGRGSVISVDIPMTRAEMGKMLDDARYLLPPAGVQTVINSQVLSGRPLVSDFETTLPTLIADDEGVLRPTRRVTRVRVYRPNEGETAMLYEMGIPVVGTGDKYHVDVQQKVPLNMDRDNVTPAYLRAVRVAVLNETFHEIRGPEATQNWVRDACGDKNVSPEAVTKIIHTRFGENSVAYDPSDAEANKLSTAEGRQVVFGGALSAEEWQQARAAGVLPPAGQVTPSPKPFSPDGSPLKLIPEAEWTPGMLRVAKFVTVAGRILLNRTVPVQITNDSGWNFAATYGPKSPLIFNVAKLGYAFFEEGIGHRVLDLVIHEFGHHYSGDHLSSAYYDGLTSLGARMTTLALGHPEVFA